MLKSIPIESSVDLVNNIQVTSVMLFFLAWGVVVFIVSALKMDPPAWVKLVFLSLMGIGLLSFIVSTLFRIWS